LRRAMARFELSREESQTRKSVSELITN